MGVGMSFKGLSTRLWRWLLCSSLLWAPEVLAEPQSSATHRVAIATDLGEIQVELYADKAPRTVDNFLNYSRRYYYDGLIFHRVVKNFVIQSGGYTFDLFAKEPGEPIPNESDNGLKNRRGTIAMARLRDPDSARAQFFINLRNNPNLDTRGRKLGYTVFGKVVKGMDVVDAIGKVEVESFDEFSHIPVNAIRIHSVREVPEL